VTAFARKGAAERAARVLRERDETTTVPPEFFDGLSAALDAPAQPNRALAEAAARLRQSVTRD
jgi:uncharacterized protein (DUF1778 family)